MSVLKFTDQRHWTAIETHLSPPRGERFAFAHTRCIHPSPDPILEVVGVELVPPSGTTNDDSGWTISDGVLDAVHNRAIAGGYGLVEFHNHARGPARFSIIDEAGLTPMADYVTSIVPDRVYGAGVYAEGRVHVEHWTRASDGLRRDRFRSVVLLGHQLKLLNPPEVTAVGRLARQNDVLGPYGAETLAGLRVAVVGLGGTGSQTALTLGYLGVGELLLLDDDIVEESNLNRLVTAGCADLGAPKSLVARRRLREIDPGLQVRAMSGVTLHGDHAELVGVDAIFGCVDDDGPRDALNEIAVHSATPYFDIATGILTETTPATMGGHVICVIPGGPCLHCLGELDPGEVGRWAKSSSQRAEDRRHGYGTTEPNPAVTHLNGLAANAAVAELVAWVAGHRPPAQYLDIDINGSFSDPSAPVGTTVTPRHPTTASSSCLACGRHSREAVFAAELAS